MEARSGPSVGSGGAPSGDPLDAFAVGGGGPAQKGVQGIVKCGPGEIYEAVRSVMRVNSNQLNHCYQTAIKANEGLRGTWDASFVVQKDGTTAAVKAKGAGVSDPGLEACIVRQIERWSFPQLCEATPIETPLRFGL